MPAKKAAKGNAHGRKKAATKRKRFGKTGRDTRQAKASERAAADTKQIRQTRQLREIRSLAVAALERLDASDYDALRVTLTKMASLGDK
jgi:hypothetical protein